MLKYSVKGHLSIYRRSLTVLNQYKCCMMTKWISDTSYRPNLADERSRRRRTSAVSRLLSRPKAALKVKGTS